ncbi:MAG: bis(5'-nucleosyl)-tetraphosphatase [Phycisphaeraceae bacterium]
MKDQTMKKDFSCGVIPYRVIDGEREFLLIQHQAGHWSFPKGHPEKGETELETACRELAEETGISDVEIDEEHHFKEHYTFTKRSGKQVSKRVIYFLGHVATGQAVVLQEAEVSDYAWGNKARTHERMSFDEGRTLLDEVLAYLGD